MPEDATRRVSVDEDPAAPIGKAASHQPRIARPLLVAPTDAADFNALSLDLVAVACIQLPDILFEFDSSFPVPGVAGMLSQIPALRQAHAGSGGRLPPLSVFGHADPTGNDDYNKVLSGRRAMAIYGALCRDTGLWNALFDHAHGGDDWKAKNVAATMHAATGLPSGTSRADLMLAYMDILSPQPMTKADFLGQGADAAGKADFQGCGEFNPQVLLSIKENAALSKQARNEQNTPNRRVIVFMFRPGTRIDTSRWPCPTALEGSAGCVKRFFGPPRTGELRRQPGDQRREFAKTLDTFACRFYDRVSRLSPCELPAPPSTLSVAPLIAFKSGSPTTVTGSAVKAGGTVGAPQISSARGIVLVKKPHTDPQRAPVLLQTDSAFAGNGDFQVQPAGTIDFFRSATGGAPIKFDNVDNVFEGPDLTAGVTLFAEARKPSKAFEDVTLTLTLKGGGKLIANNPTTRQMTAVEVFLDIHKVRPQGGAEPAALSDKDKIDPGRAVHVQNAARQRRRARVVIRQTLPALTTDQLEVSVTGATIVLFDNENPTPSDVAQPMPLTVDPAKLPLTFFAEGTTVSSAVRDTTLRLGIKGIDPDGDHAVMTVIEAKLDLFNGRNLATDTATAMSDDDKVAIGRFVHVQDTGATKRKHRAQIVVQQIKPAGFVGKLVLTATETLATPSAAARTHLFASQAPGSGASLASPLEIDHPASFPAAGATRFIEGSTASAALVDSGYRLGVKDVDPDCDRVALTVFRVAQVELKLKRTRCRRTAAADESKISRTDVETLDKLTMTVLRDAGDIEFEATVTPATVPIVWDVQRAPDDTPAANLVPTHVAGSTANKRTLTPDQTGSFHVHAFVDSDPVAGSDPVHGVDDDGVVFNLNMVEVSIPSTGTNTILQNPAYSNTRSSANSLVVDSGSSQGVFNVSPGRNGQYGDEQFALHLISFKVTVNVVGGGADGRRGIDKVFTGIIQTTTADSIVGTYADGRTLRETLFDPAVPIPPSSRGVAGIVVQDPPPGQPPLQSLAFPVRDTRGANNTRIFPFLISSSDRNAADMKFLPTGGQERVVRVIDSPAIVMRIRHPVTNSPLTAISGSNDFADFLVAFASDFPENYVEYASASWSTTYGTFTPAAGWTAAGAALTTTASMAVTSPPIAGEQSDLERCAPNFVDVIPMDAR